MTVTFDEFCQRVLGKPFRFTEAQKTLFEAVGQIRKCWDCGKRRKCGGLRYLSYRGRYSGSGYVPLCEACWNNLRERESLRQAQSLYDQSATDEQKPWPK